MKYITIDGDDIGRLITSSYLSNSEEQLIDISHNLNLSVRNIANLLEDHGFQILFYAADGVLARRESNALNTGKYKSSSNVPISKIFVQSLEKEIQDLYKELSEIENG